MAWMDGIYCQEGTMTLVAGVTAPDRTVGRRLGHGHCDKPRDIGAAAIVAARFRELARWRRLADRAVDKALKAHSKP